jgi:hypothetical protein
MDLWGRTPLDHTTEIRMNARTFAPSTLAFLAFATVATAQNSASNTGGNTFNDTTTTANSSSNDEQTFSATTSDLTTNEHAYLKSFAGVWNGVATIHGVDGPEGSSTINCVSSLTFGTFLTTTFSGKIMGEQFQAVQTWGFNTATSQFETTWIDNSATSITFNNGSCNAEGTVFTIDGQVTDEAGDTITQRSVTTLVDNDHFNLELISIDSKDVATPVMTISFTRLATTTARGQWDKATLVQQATGQWSNNGQSFTNTNVDGSTSTATTATNAGTTNQSGSQTTANGFKAANVTGTTTPATTTGSPLGTVNQARVTPRPVEVQIEVTSAQLDAARRTASESEPRN